MYRKLEAKKLHLFQIESFALSIFARIAASFSLVSPNVLNITFESEFRENFVGYTNDVGSVIKQCN